MRIALAAFAAVLAAVLCGGCTIDATVETTLKGMTLAFPRGEELSGQLLSESRDVPLKLSAPLEKPVSSVLVEAVVLEPLTGVQTLDFFRGITLVAHGSQDVELISLGQELLQPAPDGSLTLPVDVGLDADFIQSGLSIEADIEFIVPEVDWSVGETFELQLRGGTTLP